MYLCRKSTLSSSLLAVILLVAGSGLAAEYQPQTTHHQDHRASLKLDFVETGQFKSPLQGEALAREFLRVRASDFALPGDLNNLRLAMVQESLLGTHYRFQQTLHGIDVDKAEIIVSVRRDTGEVYRVYNNTYPVKAEPDVAVAKLGVEAAYDSAWRNLRVWGGLLAEPASRLVYSPEGTGFRLNYIVDLNVEAPYGAWASRVDAGTGEVVEVRDTLLPRLKREPTDLQAPPGGPMIQRAQALQAYRAKVAERAQSKAGSRKANGTGQVFDPDPRTTLQLEGLQDGSPAASFTPAYFTRDLLDITENAGTFSLTGPWVDIVNWEAPNTLPSTTTTGNWNFTRGNNAFNDAMTYFHLDQNQRYMQSLGFVGATGIQQGPIQADADGFSGADNSAYFPSTNRLTFGHGCVDDNEDADVILHEYGHAINFSINPSWGGGDAGGMGEGFGDYWAGSYSFSTPNGPTFHPEWMFSWDGHGTGNQCWPGRIMNATAAQYVHTTNYGAHQSIPGGFQSDELWATPLFQSLVDLVGMGETREEVDTIILEAQFGLSSGIKMRDMANAIVATANSLYPGQPHAAVLTEKFQVHNILLANPADIDVTAPAPFAVAPGGSDCANLIIDNLGEAALSWVIAEDDPLAKDAGGPDAFGYTWIDSNEPGGPVFNWQDISAVGTSLSLGDDGFADVSLPFSFPFYGVARAFVRIDSNGYLTFGSGGSTYINASIPGLAAPNSVIAPFWDDMNPLLGGTIHHHDAGGGTFIVQYTAIQRFGGGSPQTFQVILTSDGGILFQYLDATGTTNNATVGIEDSSGSVGLQVAFNEPYVQSNLAVRFELLDPCPWLTVLPQGGTTAGTSSTSVQVCVDATGLAAGTYNCNLVISSDDPDEPTVVVPISMTVGSGSGPATATVTTGASNQVSVYVVPDGSGRPLSQALAWDGVPGNQPTIVDATVTVRLEDGSANPVPGYAAASISMGTSLSNLVHCVGSGTADANTNLSGETTFSGTMTGGGHSDPGELTTVTVSGAPGITMSYSPPPAANGLNILFNSADITGDLMVDLGDIGAFSNDLVQNYDYRSDFFWDGAIDLSDIGIFSAAIGRVCAAGKEPVPAGPTAPGELGVFFDLTGTRRSVKVEPGVEVDAYILLKGEVASDGILAWEAAVRTSSNVEVADWTLPETSLNLGVAPDFLVGTGGSRRAKAGDPLLLATMRLTVTDDQPASIYIDPSSLRSGGHSAPVIADGEAVHPRLRPMASSDQPVATLNDGSGPRASLPAEYLYNVPNPFNPSTEVRFAIPRDGNVEVLIYDVSGRLISTLRAGELTAGSHAIQWNGQDSSGDPVVSGLYFARMVLDGAATGTPIKMSLVK